MSVGAATEAEAVAAIEPQRGDPVAAEVAGAVRAKTENPFAREEIAGTERSAATAENETTTAEKIAESVTTDGADQVETETGHALVTVTVTVIEDEATAHAVEVAAETEETESDPAHLHLPTEMQEKSRRRSKLK